MRDARKSQGTQYSWRRVVVVKILPHVNMKIENQASNPDTKNNRNTGKIKTHTPEK